MDWFGSSKRTSTGLANKVNIWADIPDWIDSYQNLDKSDGLGFFPMFLFSRQEYILLQKKGQSIFA